MSTTTKEPKKFQPSAPYIKHVDFGGANFVVLSLTSVDGEKHILLLKMYILILTQYLYPLCCSPCYRIADIFDGHSTKLQIKAPNFILHVLGY